MTPPELFDPLVGPARGWPPTAAMERDMLTEFCRLGTPALVANLRTGVHGLQSEGRVLPVTVNETEYGDAYVCLPHTAYALYAKAELNIVNVGRWRPALHAMADIAGAALRAARINRIVHLNNWMLSTNLHNGWTGADIAAIRTRLVAAFPTHFLAVRSVNRWSDPALADNLLADGWLLLPSRQIYVTDDPARDWAPKRDARQDVRLLSRSVYVLDDMVMFRPGDAARIAALYAQLYLERYSRLNPAFTESFIALAHRSGMLRFTGVRDAEGKLMAVAGCFLRNGVLTTPVLGYDTSRPQCEGLYRIASTLLTRMAIEAGVRLNGSAGAAGFKKLRGARPVLEYTAFYTHHLSPARRATISGLHALLNHVAVPFMQSRGF